MQETVWRRTDRMFAVLILCQWAFGVACAVITSPKTWSGLNSQVHVHVWAALFLGGAISFLPVLLAWQRPGWVFTRHTIAVAQILWSALLIHLTGGRIETHFHIFGSLAFLAFYRDWRVLITATLVVAADHAIRGMFWPQSVFGVLAASQWRWLEHAGWVVFEDIFLIQACLFSQKEMREICAKRAALENVNQEIEHQIKLRTRELEFEKSVTEKQAVLLSRSNEELRQFAYVASHDLQEPLRMVTSYLQLISKRYKGKLDSDADEFIDFAVDGATRMKRLINDLLDYSRVSTHAKEKKQINAEDTFLKALSNLKIALEESDTVVTHDPLPQVWADDGQLERLFQNLVGNAVKYRKKDSKQAVHVRAQQTDTGWHFSIRDHGIGIAKEHQERVFVIFQRLHSAQEYSGTGIGLAVCQKIVQNHGGKIWIESEPDMGSVFHFTIANHEQKEFA